MTRRTALQIAHVIVAMLLATPLVNGQGTIKVINAGGANAPVLIMVVADHYVATDQTEFDYDVENFFKYGLLLDKYYKTQLPNLRILSYFDATPAGQASSYGFTIASGAGNCAITDDTITSDKLNATLNSVPNVPSRVHFLVVGNYPYDFGCTNGLWTYVAVGAAGTDILQHEFGHRLGALFDEWPLATNGGTSYPGFIPPGDIRNCWPKPAPPATTTPHWVANYPVPPAPPFDNVEGCDLYKVGVQHPYHMCRMGATHHKEFCYVCAKAMDSALLDLVNPERQNGGRGPGPGAMNLLASHERTAPMRFGFVNASFGAQPVPAKPPEPQPIARLVVEFNASTEKLTMNVRRPSFVNGIYAPSYRRLSNYLYEIVDNSGTKEIGILNGQLLRPRGYRGGGGQHGTGSPGGVEIVISIPDEDQKRFEDKTRGLQLVMYRIPTAITDATINKDRFAQVKDRLERLFAIPLPPPEKK